MKNLLVVAAPVAGGRLPASGSAMPLGTTLLAWCAAAGGIYILNDVADVAADRRHPRKARRPIAAGELPTAAARRAAAVLLTAGVLLGLAVSPAVAVAVGAYELMSWVYSQWLKHIPVIDVVVLAAGFVLRVLAGAAATGTAARTSFFSAVFFGVMFVALTKRRGERHELGALGSQHRRVLSTYSERILAGLLAGSLTAAAVSYTVWAVVRPDGEGAVLFDLSVVPFLVGAGRYTYLASLGAPPTPSG